MHMADSNSQLLISQLPIFFTIYNPIQDKSVAKMMLQKWCLRCV